MISSKVSQRNKLNSKFSTKSVIIQCLLVFNENRQLLYVLNFSIKLFKIFEVQQSTTNS